MAEKTKSMHEQLEEIQLRTAQMNMKLAERELQKFEAKERSKSVQNAQRQSELASKMRGRWEVARKCAHKQGASPKNIYKGKGDTTLKKVRMMDGFTMLIHCAICRLAVFSPHPYDRNPEPQIDYRTRRMETEVQARKRVAKWESDTEAFAELMEKSEESKSDEYSSTMDCGNSFEVKDHKGMPVYRRRPSDFYPQPAA
jgi:galactokinase